MGLISTLKRLAKAAPIIIAAAPAAIDAAKAARKAVAKRRTATSRRPEQDVSTSPVPQPDGTGRREP